MFLRPLDAAYSILYIRDDRYVYTCTSTEESIPVAADMLSIFNLTSLTCMIMGY